MVATEAEPLFAQEAKVRQGARTDIHKKVYEGKAIDRQATSQAGKTLQVNHQYVSQAKKLKAEHPQIAEQVKAGQLMKGIERSKGGFKTHKKNRCKVSTSTQEPKTPYQQALEDNDITKEDAHRAQKAAEIPKECETQ